MKRNGQQTGAALLGWLIIAGLILTIIIVIAVFCGNLMRLFGFAYQSTGSVILYFVLIVLFSFPLEVLAKSLPAALVSLGKLSPRGGVVVFFLLDTAATAGAMYAADRYMSSVTVSGRAILAVSLLFALLSIKDFGQLCQTHQQQEGDS